jgi:hypothetical protein
MKDRQEPCEPPLPGEREAWTAANIVIEKHGSGAQDHAKARITALMGAGDHRGVQAWRLILDRIEQMQSTTGPHQ